MRIGKAMSVFGAAALLAVVFSSFSTEARAGGRQMVRFADMEGGDGGGTAVNLTVQKVTVQPVRAYVGDVVDVEVWIDDREDGRDTTWAELLVGKKVVAKQMFTWGGPGAERTSRMHIKWDTSGMAPGVYKLKVEAFVYEDIYPFDNEFAVKQPVILAAPGEGFPGGEQAGGSVTEIDERYK